MTGWMQSERYKKFNNEEFNNKKGQITRDISS